MYSLCSRAHKTSQFCHRLRLGREERCSSYLCLTWKQCLSWCLKVFFFLQGDVLDGDFLHGRDICWCWGNPAEHPAYPSVTPGVQPRAMRDPQHSVGGKGPKGRSRPPAPRLPSLCLQSGIIILIWSTICYEGEFKILTIKKTHYRWIIILVLRPYQNINHTLIQLQWIMLYE